MFVWIGALKISAGSTGTAALVGIVIAAGLRLPLAVALAFAAAGASLTERVLLTRRRR